MIQKQYQKLLDGIFKTVFTLLALMVAAMVVIGFMQVFWRYILMSSLSWSEETLRYVNIWTIFLGAGLCIPRGLHTAIEAIYSVLSPKSGAAMIRVVELLGCAFAMLMTVVGWSFSAFNAAQVSPTMQVPMIYVYISIPIGGVLMLMFQIGEMLKPRKGGAA